MKGVDLKTIAAAVGGSLPFGGDDRVVSGVCTDNRKVAGGELFVALKGERFDAHAFAQSALEAGAAGVFVENTECTESAEGTILVGNTLTALQRLARWWRAELGLPVIGLTGSNGKTSTKDFTKAVVGTRYRIRATVGNLNNHIGVPLSVLSLEEGDEVGIFEMGMNHPGEIAPLCEIAKPHIGIITNIGTAHIEYMGSRDAIAEEKGALARSLPEVGTLLVPVSCDYMPYLVERTRAQVVGVGNGRGDVRAEEIDGSSGTMSFQLVFEGEGKAQVHLKVAGRHMVTNALLAAAAGRALGIGVEDAAKGLTEAVLTSGRLRAFQAEGVKVFDDTYNANPDSMRAGLETLAEASVGEGGRRFAVLGRMAELGEHAEREHKALGESVAGMGIGLLAVGEGAEGIAEGAGGNFYFAEKEQAAKWLSENLKEGDAVLFKGSRAAAIEEVMNLVFTD
ncbi:MAG: UDP-N-acetylmuramoyl-tripeptide--D-alanyl-D-alanine ligase [Verrucomicrobiota bacterium JB023]|nr:UDP-N-acetylmuramoyl-tripeptide--D-alanyl-D-alanine ligase [Verrucomicrobiota bacterium JB023]